MADDFQGENEVLCFEIHKNERSRVRARLYTFGGHRLADLRLYVENRDGDYVPTRRGIAIRTAQLPQLAEAIQELREEVEREEAAS